MLRVNLVSVFMVDEFRRVLCEAIIPYLTQNKDQISKDVQAKIKKTATQVSDVINKSTDSIKDPSKDSNASADDLSRAQIEENIIQEELHELEKDEVE